MVHVDYTEPYCPEIRDVALKAAAELGYKAHDHGVYVCTEGPRFETPAEIRMFAKLGGDLVGMTNVPEVVLAREAGICYATVSLVTNYAAGIADGPLTHEEVVALMAENNARLKQLLMRVLTTLPPERKCRCREAVLMSTGFLRRINFGPDVFNATVGSAVPGLAGPDAAPGERGLFGL